MPRALPLARGMSKPVARGENACTRDDGSGGPVTARSGGTTDHAAERNAGSGQAGSVTERSDGASPCGTRTAWSGAGPRRTSPTAGRGTCTASRASGERRTGENHDAERSTLHGSTATTTDGQGLRKRAAIAASVGPYTSPRSRKTKTRTTTLNQRPDYGLLITQDGGSHEAKESPPSYALRPPAGLSFGWQAKRAQGIGCPS